MAFQSAIEIEIRKRKKERVREEKKKLFKSRLYFSFLRKRRKKAHLFEICSDNKKKKTRKEMRNLRSITFKNGQNQTFCIYLYMKASIDQ